ncbi:MAG: undecaprenyl-diphosphate phosphatase [Clostridiales bacterium]|jgi:undecaprenyl-diphosphatase|nr:undecaprenyl-diphosphate phosphatase [Clostridiales bacterium]
MLIIECLKALFLGLIEGVTEWLPISSTGHMILLDQFIHLSVSPQFKEMFLVVIQLGAILAVVMLYFTKLNPWSSTKTKVQKTDTLTLWAKVIIACIPAGIIGLLFDDLLDQLFYNFQTVAIMLILYGVLFIIIENRNAKRNFTVTDFKSLSYKTALTIGAFQLLSLIPGTSRSGATILGAVLIGTSRAVAAEFSFFLAIPVMLGASALKLLKFGLAFTSTEIAILAIGMISAFIVSVIAIKFLVSYIQRNDFKAFGYYRIILGVILIIYYFIAM